MVHLLRNVMDFVSWKDRRGLASALKEMIVYTTNATEAGNPKLCRAVRAHAHFPSDDAATKLLYLILNGSEESGKCDPVNGPWPRLIRHHLRRALHQSHGDVMFNRPYARTKFLTVPCAR